MAKRTLLIDADIIAYKYAVQAEEATKWDDDLWTLHADETRAAKEMADGIDHLCDQLEADNVVVALSDPERRYFRHDLFESYKGGRSGNRPPLILNALKDHLSGNYNSFVRPGLEADDILGILSTSDVVLKNAGQKIIVSIDKDMKCIPGFLFNPDKDEGIAEVGEWDADLFHLMQTLIGDSTDGYPGCPGVGPKTAEKILAGVETVEEGWEKVVKAFAKAKFGEEEALLQARLARICRASDYDFENRKVILWTPPKEG